MVELAPKDRNLVSFYGDAGIAFEGFIANRPKDVLTFGIAYSRISPDAVAGDRDLAVVSAMPQPIRDAETIFELSYMASISPWWTIQQDLQYFVHPGGNVPLTSASDQPIPNTWLAGLHSQIKF